MSFIEAFLPTVGLFKAGKQAVDLVNSAQGYNDEPVKPEPVVPITTVEKTVETDLWKSYSKSRDFYEVGRLLGATGPNPSTYKGLLDRIQAEAEGVFEEQLEAHRRKLAAVENQVVIQRNLPSFSAESFEVQKFELNRLIELTQKHLEGVARYEGPFRPVFRQFHNGFEDGVAAFNRENDFITNKQ